MSAITTQELENMARATRMTDDELVSHLRTIAGIFDERQLAKWVIGVAAERIESRMEPRSPNKTDQP